MSKTRKVVSLALAMVMMLCMFSVIASADDTGSNSSWTISSTAAGTNVAVGTDVTVALSLTTDYAVGPIGFSLNYDSAKLTYKSAAVGAGYPATYGANPHFTVNGTNGKVIGAIIADTSAMTSPVSAVRLTNAVVVNVTFTVVAAGGTVSINKDVKSDANINGKLYAAKSNSGIINQLGTGFSYGQVTAYVTDTLTFGSAAPATPELTVVAGTGGVIDTANGYVYGIEIDNGDTVDSTFTATNGGSINVVANIYDLTEATGATLQLLDAVGGVVAEYTVIIFGDVNCDGMIDSTDSTLICEWEGGVSYSDDIYQEFAGDVNMDMAPDSTDATLIEENEGGISILYTQTDIAAAYVA